MSSSCSLLLSVSLRDRATGRYLSAGAEWSDDGRDALVVDRAEALRFVQRFSCEPDGVELVNADDVGSSRAVA